MTGSTPNEAAPASRRRRVGRGVAAAVAGLVLICAVAVFAFGDEIAGFIGLSAMSDAQVEAAVHEAFQSANAGDTVVLTDATDFRWDTVGVFTPYYPHEDIVREMGVDVPRTATNHLINSESHCLLLFRRADRIAAWTTVDRRVADCTFEATGIYSADEARFQGDALVPAK